MSKPKHFCKVLIWVIAGLAVFTTQWVMAEQLGSSAAFSAQSEAKLVLAKAIKAAGGYQALSRLNTGTVTFATQTAAVGQGLTPETDPTLGDAFRTITYRSGGRLSIENFNGDNIAFRLVLGEEPDWAWLAGQNAISNIGPSISGRIFDRVSTSGHVLLELSQRSEALRATGKKEFDGKTYNMVSYADDFGRLQSLAFNQRSGHLMQMQRLDVHAQWGDIANVVSFGEYKKAGDALVSHQINMTQAGMLTTKAKVERIEFTKVDDAIFTKPEDAGENPPINGPENTPRNLEVETLAENIYYIPNAAQGYNTVFVDQHDGIVIIETPQSPQAGRDIVNTVKKQIPNKKIKFAVPTHHHFDHSGGLYGFIESGIPILTTPGNVDFVRQIGAASRNIGRHARRSKKLRVESFDGRRSLGRGNRIVELINVGPNPHVEEIIVAYIPAIKTMLVADLYSFRGDNVTPANENQLAFADKLESLDLEIETFIPVHGSQATAEQFWESVKLGREALKEE